MRIYGAGVFLDLILTSSGGFLKGSAVVAMMTYNLVYRLPCHETDASVPGIIYRL